MGDRMVTKNDLNKILGENIKEKGGTGNISVNRRRMSEGDMKKTCQNMLYHDFY